MQNLIFWSCAEISRIFYWSNLIKNDARNGQLSFEHCIYDTTCFYFMFWRIQEEQALQKNNEMKIWAYFEEKNISAMYKNWIVRKITEIDYCKLLQTSRGIKQEGACKINLIWSKFFFSKHPFGREFVIIFVVFSVKRNAELKAFKMLSLV